MRYKYLLLQVALCAAVTADTAAKASGSQPVANASNTQPFAINGTAKVPNAINSTNSTAKAKKSAKRSKKAKKDKKKRRPQLDLLLEKLGNSSDVLKAITENTKVALTWSHDLLLVVYMPVLEGLLTLSSAARDSRWGDRLDEATKALHLTSDPAQGSSGSVSLLQTAGLMLSSGLVGYCLARWFRRRPKHESVHWLQTWWTTHPPVLNVNKLQEALARQLNEYLRSSTGSTSQNVAKIPVKVVEVRLGDPCTIPALRDVQVVQEIIGDGGQVKTSLEADFDLASSQDQMVELEVEVDNFLVHVAVKTLRGRAALQLTNEAHPVASLSCLHISACDLDVTSVARLSLGPVRSIVRAALRNFLLAPRSVQWRLSSAVSTTIAPPSLSKQPKVPNVGGAAAAPRSSSPQAHQGAGVVTLRVLRGHELVPEFPNAAPSVMVVVQQPYQRLQTPAALHPTDPVFDADLKFSINSQTRAVLLQVIDTDPDHSDANLIGEGVLKIAEALQGGVEVKLEHPEYSGVAGYVSVKAQFALNTTPVNGSAAGRPSSTSPPLFGPGTARHSPSPLSVHALQAHDLTTRSPIRQQDLDAISAVGSEAPSMLSARTPPGQFHSGGLPAGWNFQQPVELIETTHSYGTHLSVVKTENTPETLRTWKAKTRKLVVHRGHAFAQVSAKAGAACAISGKSLHKTLRNRKAMQCTYCLMVLAPDAIAAVSVPCRDSQLPPVVPESSSRLELNHPEASISPHAADQLQQRSFRSTSTTVYNNMSGLHQRSSLRDHQPLIEVDNASSERPSSILPSDDRRPSGNHLTLPNRRAAPELSSAQLPEVPDDDNYDTMTSDDVMTSDCSRPTTPGLMPNGIRRASLVL
eukprot:m.9415 g.9415  ORF g.9415 m.9415 type:complete len:864 (-) comp9415_c0_seq6:34-2625(-)